MGVDFNATAAPDVEAVDVAVVRLPLYPTSVKVKYRSCLGISSVISI